MTRKTKPSFEEAFPDVEDILARCGTNPAPVAPNEHSDTLSIRARWPYEGAIVRCTRSDCRLPGGADEQGFFDLTSAIEEALASPNQVSERLLSCNGKLAGNGGQRGRDAASNANALNCDNTLYCRIEVLRKPQTVAGGAG
jgi:hypothetical protein